MPRFAGAEGFGAAGVGAGARRGAGAGWGATKVSTWGPPAKASRERLRQKRNAPPAPRINAASSHGTTGNLCSGASGPAPGSGAKSAAAGVVAAPTAPLVLSRLGSATVTDDDGADWRSGSGARSVCTGEGCGRDGSAEAIRAGRGASA